MTILVDIDSTITNFGEILLLANNQLHNTSYLYTDITSYDWFDQTFTNPWEPTAYQCFWNTVEVNPAAVTAIEQWVKQGHKVYLVTASFFNSTLGYKIHKTLKPFNPELINERNVIIAQDKAVVMGDVLIDDAPHNILSFPAYAVTYAQPWNQDIPYPHSILRANDWNKIDAHVKRIECAKYKK